MRPAPRCSKRREYSVGIIDIDRAILRLQRRLDRILNCTSGMPNYELVAARIQKIRAALAKAKEGM